MRATRQHFRFVAALGAGALVVLGVAGVASAEPTFPQAVEEHLKTACLVQCTLCHQTLAGGVNLPSDATGRVLPDLGGARGQGDFFANMIHLNGGKLPANETQLLAYIDNLKTKPCSTNSNMLPCDSDGDGTSDYVELTQSRDPDKVDAAASAECAMPTYGCGAHIGTLPREAPATGRAAALMALLGAGLVFARRAGR